MLAGGNSKDRRIQKTQEHLRGALRSLIGEKPYDSIVVKEILDRANVGRSTFYSHFRDKDDLLVSGIHDMLRRSSRRLRPLLANGKSEFFGSAFRSSSTTTNIGIREATGLERGEGRSSMNICKGFFHVLSQRS